MSHPSQPEFTIRDASVADASAIASIYNWYIENTTVTFELEPLSDSVMAERIKQAEPNNPWIVLEQEKSVIGFADVTPWKSRAAYRLAKETSVYVRHDSIGRGVGAKLMRTLIDKTLLEPIHVLIAGITLPNVASVALHEKLGFCYVGKFTEVGYKFDQHIDVGYWQLIMDDI